MAESFWSKGVRFQCQGTGRCCVARDTYGYVYVNLEDRRRLARHLKIPTRAFTRKYCQKTDGHFHFKEFKGPCTFLQGKACGVYEGRPSQCRTWPFWPENMNARTWSREIKSFCPGVDQGRLYTAEEIQAMLRQDPVAPKD
jgi:Fe-S-cluster containining protein